VGKRRRERRKYFRDRMVRGILEKGAAGSKEAKKQRSGRVRRRVHTEDAERRVVKVAIEERFLTAQTPFGITGYENRDGIGGCVGEARGLVEEWDGDCDGDCGGDGGGAFGDGREVWI
jgi:hypothetical protein